MNFERFILNQKLSIESQKFLLAIFITNIGNGFYTLTLSKLIYDKTGSILGFGLILMSEQVAKILLQTYAGYIADKISPIKICKYSDLFRGILFLLAAVCLYHKNFLLCVSLTTFAVNFFKPFYIASAFCFAIYYNPSEVLKKYNALFLGLKQGGYLIGVMMSGLLLVFLNTHDVIFLDGITYFISFLLIHSISNYFKGGTIIRGSLFSISELIRDWKETIRLIKNDSRLIVAVLKPCLDPIIFCFIQIMLVPLSVQFYHGKPIVLSLLQSAFVFGMIIGHYSMEKIYVFFPFLLKQRENSLPIIQGILIACLPFGNNIYIHLFILFITGIFNTDSLSYHYSQLQKETPSSYQAKIVSIYLIITSLMLGFYISVISYMEMYHFYLSFLFTALIIFCLSLIIKILKNYSLKLQ